MRLFFLILVFTSCTSSIDIDIPEHQPKMVINSLFKEGETIHISVTQSTGIADNFAPPIENTHIQLFQDNTFVENLVFNGNEFESNLITQPHTEYTVIAEFTTAENCSARDIVPQKPVISNASIQNVSIADTEGFILNQKLKLTIDDPASSSDYYELLLILKNQDLNGNFFYTPVYYYYTHNPIITNEGILQYYPTSLVFSDTLFNGQQAVIDVYYNVDEEWINTGYTLSIYLRGISTNYYQYKKSHYKHVYNQEPDLWEGGETPTPMYSNISNGYGIFAAFAETHIEIQN